jgi:hypothetical protein
MFLRDPEGDASPIRFSAPQLAVLLLLAIPTLVFGLYYAPIVELANASVIMFGVR